MALHQTSGLYKIKPRSLNSKAHTLPLKYTNASTKVLVPVMMYGLWINICLSLLFISSSSICIPRTIGRICTNLLKRVAGIVLPTSIV